MPFTKLTNVPVKESMTGNEKIIINDDGVTRQANIPNYVKTIGGVTPDQNGNVEIELGESWPSDLPKPSIGGYGYTESGEQVLFDGDLLIDHPVSGGAVASAIDIDIDSFEVGKTYKIVWNGVDYTCECIGEGEIVYLGNISIIGIPVVTDEPFVFVVGEGVATMVAGTYSIKVSKIGETIHKINEKYLPEGGFGYTEQGEKTVITWDGDTEGKVSFADSYYKVKDYTAVSKTDLIGCVFGVQNDEDHPTPFEVDEDDINDSMIQHAIMISDYAIIVSEPTSYGPYSFTESGIYFAKLGELYTSSLIYGGETIHKIDEKYLPEAGASMVEVSWDNTYEEVLEILNSGSMPYMQLNSDWGRARLYVSSVNRNSARRIEFGSPAVGGTSMGTRNFCVYVDSNGWSNIMSTNSVHISNDPYPDGTYVLTCTVTDGDMSYTWEKTQNESDDMWQSITEYIDEKLGAIENGSY